MTYTVCLIVWWGMQNGSTLTTTMPPWAAVQCTTQAVNRKSCLSPCQIQNHGQRHHTQDSVPDKLKELPESMPNSAPWTATPHSAFLVTPVSLSLLHYQWWRREVFRGIGPEPALFIKLMKPVDRPWKTKAGPGSDIGGNLFSVSSPEQLTPLHATTVRTPPLHEHQTWVQMYVY